MANLSVLEYEKALLSLKDAFIIYENETVNKTKVLFRDATIQRFEFTIELGWKVAMKNLGQNVSSPKPAIREMARAGYIKDIQIWFDAIEARNKSSHSYDEDVAIEIIEKIKKFIPHAELLLSKLNQP